MRVGNISTFTVSVGLAIMVKGVGGDGDVTSDVTVLANTNYSFMQILSMVEWAVWLCQFIVQVVENYTLVNIYWCQCNDWMYLKRISYLGAASDFSHWPDILTTVYKYVPKVIYNFNFISD